MIPPLSVAWLHQCLEILNTLDSKKSKTRVLLSVVETLGVYGLRLNDGISGEPATRGCDIPEGREGIL